MLSNIQYDFLGHLHPLLHLRVTLSTHTHIAFRVVKESISKRQGLRRIGLFSLQDLRPAVSQRLLYATVDLYGLKFTVCSL